jgi:acyl-CoA synthetase (NDP forming)
MVASASPNDYARAIRAVASDPNVDAIIVNFIPPIAVRPEEIAKEILKVAGELNGRIPILSTFMAYHGVSEILSDGQSRIPSYPFPETAAGALARAVQYGKWLATPEGNVPTFSDVRREDAAAIVAHALREGGRWLNPEEVENLLDCYGIPLIRTLCAENPEEAGNVAAQLGGQVVLKAVAPGLIHKTEAGAVRLALVGEEETKKSAEEMLEKLESDGLKNISFIVQPMVAAGIEMLWVSLMTRSLGRSWFGTGGSCRALKDVPFASPRPIRTRGNDPPSKDFTSMHRRTHYDVTVLEKLSP